jgi:hypothetical protein
MPAASAVSFRLRENGKTLSHFLFSIASTSLWRFQVILAELLAVTLKRKVSVLEIQYAAGSK